MNLKINVPKLDHDAMMLAEFGHKLSVRERLERRIVATLIDHLAAYDWQIAGIDDGDVWVRVTDTKGAMELLFNLDMARLQFKKEDCANKIVLIVLGNGEDIISDYTYSLTDNFQAVMDEFDVEKILETIG